jgi:uncharacterized protein YbjT (DUF2867 family)
MSRILIVGATGMLGEPVARRLRADGHEVRILARDPDAAARLFAPDFDIVAGDATDRAALDRALRGCTAVHVNLRGKNTFESYRRDEQRGVETIAAAAAHAGLGRISYTSAAGDPERLTGFPLARIKQACERAIEASGVPFTIFRPTHFMESLPKFIQRGHATVIGHQPHRYHYLAAADYAAMVSKALRMPECASRALTIFGPQPLTMFEALSVYCRSLVPPLAPRRIPMPLFRLLAYVRNDPDMKFAASLFAGFSRIGESGDPSEARRLLGPATTTLEDWCRRRCA